MNWRRLVWGAGADLPPAEPYGRFLACPNCSSTRCHVYKPIVKWWLPDGHGPEPRPAGATNHCIDCGELWDADEQGARPTKKLYQGTKRGPEKPEKPKKRDADLKWREG